jgi:NADH:ubiquinone oxidoreductase subunit
MTLTKSLAHKINKENSIPIRKTAAIKHQINKENRIPIGKTATIKHQINKENRIPIGKTAAIKHQINKKNRHAEYRYKQSSIHGKLRSAVSGSLDAWHLSQFFTSRPTLGSGFIQDNPPFPALL